MKNNEKRGKLTKKTVKMWVWNFLAPFTRPHSLGPLGHPWPPSALVGPPRPSLALTGPPRPFSASLDLLTLLGPLSPLGNLVFLIIVAKFVD